MSKLPSPPFEALPARLEAIAVALEQGGRTAEANTLRDTLAQWAREQDEWNQQVREILGVHHEINNALVGVRGNAQLMLMQAAGQTPGVRERLEVVLRESSRIQEATGRLGELKGVLGRPVQRPHAA